MAKEEQAEGQAQESTEQLQSRLSGQDRLINEMKQANQARQEKLAAAGFGTFDDMMASARAQTVAPPGRTGRSPAEAAAAEQQQPAALEINVEDYRTSEGELDVGKIILAGKDLAVTQIRAETKEQARATETSAIDQAARSEMFKDYRSSAEDGRAIGAMIEERAMQLSPNGPANPAQVELATQRAKDDLDRMYANRLGNMDATALANLAKEPPAPGGTGHAGSADEVPPPTLPEDMSVEQLQAHAQNEAAGMIRARQTQRAQEAGQRA